MISHLSEHKSSKRAAARTETGEGVGMGRGWGCVGRVSVLSLNMLVPCGNPHKKDIHKIEKVFVYICILYTLLSQWEFLPWEIPVAPPPPTRKASCNRVALPNQNLLK